MQSGEWSGWEVDGHWTDDNRLGMQEGCKCPKGCPKGRDVDCDGGLVR